jgi:hypothetical protein
MFTAVWENLWFSGLSLPLVFLLHTSFSEEHIAFIFRVETPKLKLWYYGFIERCYLVVLYQRYGGTFCLVLQSSKDTAQQPRPRSRRIDNLFSISVFGLVEANLMSYRIFPTRKDSVVVKFEVFTAFRIIMIFWILSPSKPFCKCQPFGPEVGESTFFPKRWHLPVSLHGAKMRKIINYSETTTGSWASRTS